MSEKTIPERYQHIANELGFEIRGWDDDGGAIEGHGTQYVGSQEELMAFFTGWEMSRSSIQFEIKEDEKNKGTDVLYRSILGMCASLDIEARASATIVARPQVRAFRGERIVVPDYIAPHFSFSDIRVGNKSMMVQAGDIPAIAFAARIDGGALLKVLGRASVTRIEVEEQAIKEFGKRFSFDTCPVAADMVFVVNNRSDRAIRFEGFIVGKHI